MGDCELTAGEMTVKEEIEALEIPEDVKQRILGKLKAEDENVWGKINWIEREHDRLVNLCESYRQVLEHYVRCCR